MAVYYDPELNKSGGGWGSGLGIVGTLLSFVPGMQGVGAGVGALGALLDGNYAGAASGAANAFKGNKPPVTQSVTGPSPTQSFNQPLGTDFGSGDYWQKMFSNYRNGGM